MYRLCAESIFFLRNIIKIVSSSAHPVLFIAGSRCSSYTVTFGGESQSFTFTVPSIEGLFDNMGVDFQY
jgi:hypothetical protein